MYERFEWKAVTPAASADDVVAAGVLNALFWDLAVPRDRVSARIENGWVTLAGNVQRPYEKSCAEADVRRVRGVVGVTNRILVGFTANERMQA